jgi:hypothetical protein
VCTGLALYLTHRPTPAAKFVPSAAQVPAE